MQGLLSGLLLAGSGGGGSNAPSLNFNFVDGSTFPSAVTFTRASGATFFNSSGTLTTAADNIPRIDFDPATLLARGFLVEEQRTNSIRNNTMQGAAAGTPGTLPTNWLVDPTTTGLSRQVVGTGTDGGITYVDFRIFGTAAAAANYFILFEGFTNIAALTGQTWTGTYYLKLAAGSVAGLMQLPGVGINEYTAAAQYITGAIGAGVAPTASWQRVSFTRTLSGGATVAFVLPYLSFVVNNGAAIDITLRIGLPQMEQGAFPTSVIPTTNAAVTRAADVAQVTTLTPWYNATEGTLFAESSIPAFNQTQVSDFTTAVLHNVAFTNSMAVRGYSSGGAFVWDAIGFDNNIVQFDTAERIYSALNTPVKNALAYKLDDIGNSVNGQTVSVDNTATIPSVTNLSVGGFAGANVGTQHIRRITYYPRRLTNDQLQQITA